MRVTVEYTAQLKRTAGRTREEIELADGSSLTDLISTIVAQHGGEIGRMLLTSDGSPQSTIVPFVDDRQVKWDAENTLPDGAAVTLLAPISGG